MPMQIGKNYGTLDTQKAFDGYSKVVIVVNEDNNVGYSAGDNSGRTLTLTCPFGTQKMADDILSKVRGYQYQPYSATDAHIDPAAEIGDSIAVGGIRGGLFTKDIFHGPLYTANISAPGEERINYAFPYKSAQQRKIERNFRDVSARFSVQAARITQEVNERKNEVDSLKALLEVQSGQISAKVEKFGGNASSFGWTLTDDSWTLTSNGGTLLKADKDGLEVKGKITATSGTIGGFDIESDYLSSNGQTWLSNNTAGVYIGPKGLQLGTNFQVDMYGNLSAASGHFEGSVWAGNILYGAQNVAPSAAGFLNGEAVADLSLYGYKVAASTLSTAKLTSGVNTSLGYADYANGVFNGYNTAPYVYASDVYATNVTATGSLYVPYNGGTKKVGVETVTIDGFVYNVLTI